MPGLSFIVGIIGNVISILMFASPIKTFQEVVSKKSTENYKGLPYITTLLSTSLWTFYGLLKPGGLLVITVNGAGAFLHVIYVILFLIYAPKHIKVKSVKLVGAVNVAFYGGVIVIAQAALHGGMRITLVGILCAGLTIGMYAAPLSAMRIVVKTKSTKFMPFFLSLFQFLNGAVWSAYAVLIRDFYIGIPNGIGFVLGSAQLILYVIYKNKSVSEKMEEDEGSAHLFEGVIQMHGLDRNGDSNMNVGFLNKGNSLPKPSIVREYSHTITETRSFSPFEWGTFNQKDVEKGFNG